MTMIDGDDPTAITLFELRTLIRRNQFQFDTDFNAVVEPYSHGIVHIILDRKSLSSLRVQLGYVITRKGFFWEKKIWSVEAVSISNTTGPRKTVTIERESLADFAKEWLDARIEKLATDAITAAHTNLAEKTRAMFRGTEVEDV